MPWLRAESGTSWRKTLETESFFVSGVKIATIVNLYLKTYTTREWLARVVSSSENGARRSWVKKGQIMWFESTHRTVLSHTHDSQS
jgi:hypothetical protein